MKTWKVGLPSHRVDTPWRGPSGQCGTCGWAAWRPASPVPVLCQICVCLTSTVHPALLFFLFSNKKTFKMHFYALLSFRSVIPGDEGGSVGAQYAKQGAVRSSLTPHNGGKVCPASPWCLPSWPITCFPASFSDGDFCLKQALGKPCRWLRLVLTRKERGMTQRCPMKLLREGEGGGGLGSKCSSVNLQEP